ncbi:MAG TPA: SDR family NAD(P)-dependent oxidoreductase [Gemmatimonadaceae bacterium]|nr:SDR family NAD(P)-dependent oxidoreductase [Gemmatimonadaceae bacterium]
MMAERPIAVITGASRGIGRCISMRLAGEYDIVAVARSRDGLAEVARAIESAGGRCRPVPLDITDADAVAEALGGVDAQVLINNAGVATIKPMLELTLDEWRRMVEVNVNALFYMTRAVLPAMLARHAGFIVTIGSLAGRSSFAGGTCYTATKHAVIGFMESLMLEVRDAGVRVSVVMPGSVATGFSGRSGDASWKLTPEEIADAVASVIDTPPNMLISRLEVRPAVTGSRR